MIFARKPTVPVLRLTGVIGMSTPMRQNLSLAATAGAIEKAFKMSKTPAVAILVNSPGGSPVQSNLIFRRIRQLAEENDKKVYVFCEDVAASGGYFLAIAGDEIYADPSSVIGSIGVISASFGLNHAIERLGIERRVYTSGKSKSQLDPFKPENPEDIARLKSIQSDIHDTFIGAVKERRGGRLTGPDNELFSGAFWSTRQALEFGLIDGVSDIRTKMRELFGEKVRLRIVPFGQTSLLSYLKRAPFASSAAAPIGIPSTYSLADDVLSTVEARALWSRFGL